VFTAAPLKVKLKLFTVPGQVMHNSTRRNRVAGRGRHRLHRDSQPSKRQENYKYWLNMVENLKANGLDIDSMPNVVQWNKKTWVTPRRRGHREDAAGEQAAGLRGGRGPGRGSGRDLPRAGGLTFEQIDKTISFPKIGWTARAIEGRSA